MDDIILKKKEKNIKNNNYNNKKYLYFSIMGLFLLIGVSYALIFFMERFQGSELGFSTDLLDVSISENGLVTIDNANTQKDTEGINNDKTTFTIVNNNRVPIRVIIKLVEDINSNLSLDSVRFGVLGGGEILNVDSLGNTDSVLYDFFMEPGQTASLQSTLWLDYYYEGGSISEMFSGKYVVEASNANQFAYSYLSDLVGKDKGLYAINEDGTLNTGTGTVKEYRYSGLTPDNYIYFNNEVWRIISVSSDGILKIVRNEEITMANYPGNNEYYESLDKTYQEYVLNTTFNTGAVSLTDTYTSLLTNESSSTTEGYVNYINASDYLYSAEPTYYTSALNSTNISSNTWLYGTYLTANGISGSENVLGINQNIPTATTSTDDTYKIRPCLYLKKTVSIEEGYGTLEQPYVLSYADVKELKVSSKLTIAEEIIEKVVAYSVSSPSTFDGGVVAVNTNGTLYNENDPSQAIREYRYSGPNVDNYAYFNCKDNDGTYNYGDENYNYNESNCELWRIVGIFKNSAGEWNLKLMRNTVLQASELVSTYTIEGITYNIADSDNYVYWNSVANGISNNDWTTAGLQHFLNTNQDINGVKGYYSTISSSSKALIDKNYKYYLGGIRNFQNETTSLSAYENEHSNLNVLSGNKETWNGSVSLLNLSDVGYATHSEFWHNNLLYYYDDANIVAASWMMQNTNHLNEWLMSTSYDNASKGFEWDVSGFVEIVYNNDRYYSLARPVINLDSKAIKLKGEGNDNNPYVITK